MYKKIMFLAVILSVIAIFVAGCSSQTSAGDNKKTDEPAVNENASQAEDSEMAAEKAGTEDSTSSDAKKAENPDKKDGTIIEPCSLFSKTEAENLFGVAFKDAATTEQEAVGQKICFYESDDGSHFFQISLTQEAFMKKEILEAGQTPAAIFDAIFENSINPEMIDNIGDKAFIGAPGIHVLAGSYYVAIALGNVNDPENIKKLKKAAMAAVENLEKLN